MRFIILLLLLGVPSLFVINSAHALEVNNESIDLSKSDSVDLVIMGNLNEYQSSTRLVLTILSPDGSITDYDVRTSGKGSFSETFTITNDWEHGKYSVTGKYGNSDLGSTSFVIEEPYDPRIGMITTSKSTEVIEESVVIPKTVETSESSTIPDWVRNIALWYGQRSVSEIEFINAVKFLIENKIIVVDTPTIEESVPKTIDPTPTPTKVFPDPNVDPQSYVDRYLTEQSYRDWFERNYPNKSIYEVVGLPEPTASISVVTPETITPTKKTNSDIITNSEFEIVFSNPDNYKGKWVKLTGEITQIIKRSHDNVYTFNLSSEYFDITSELWVISNPNIVLRENNCYTVEGKNVGGSEAINRLTGYTSIIPTVELEKYEETDCLDVKYPALTTLKINDSQILGNVKLTLHEIHIAEEHTRAFVEIENLGINDITFYDSDALIIQSKSQYPADSFMWLDAEYETIESEIPGNIIEKGFVFFDPIGDDSFKISFEVTEEAQSYSDYKDHEFQFNVN